MEERIQPTVEEGISGQSPPQLETYIIQIPRDQIYRVPPPEHARIVETYHSRTSKQQKNKCFCAGGACLTVVLIAVLCVIATVAIFAVRLSLYSQRPPQFSVVRFDLKPGNDRRFSVMLKVKNPNSRTTVSYNGAGKSSLFFKDQKIGGGAFTKPEDMKPEGVANVHLAIPETSHRLPPLTRKALTAAPEKSMVLKLSLPVEVKSLIRSQSMNLRISCHFMVKNSLSKNPKITKQQCRTESNV